MGKRKKIPAFVHTIEKLRDKLGVKTQAQFAELLGVKQPTVSAWLKGDETRPPSADSYIRMAALARDEDLALELLNLGGVTGEQLSRVSSLLTHSILKRVIGNSIREIVVNGETFGGICADGEVITVDLAEKDRLDLEPFWDRVVLVEFSPSIEDRQEPGRQWRGWPHKPFWVGRLVLKSVSDSPDIQLGIIECDISPGVVSGVRASWRVGDRGICIGSWSLGLTSSPPLETLTFPEVREWQKLARGQMRVFEGCQILGRVVGWSARPRSKAGERN